MKVTSERTKEKIDQILPPAPAEFEESVFADRLLTKIGKIRTCGKTWYHYNSGTWNIIKKDIFSPVVLADLPQEIKTACSVNKVINHVQHKSQVDESIFCGFYKFDSNDNILVNCGNGVVRISKRKIELLEPTPEYGFTLKTRANYNPRAKCLLFDKHVAWMFTYRLDRDLL